MNIYHYPSASEALHAYVQAHVNGVLNEHIYQLPSMHACSITLNSSISHINAKNAMTIVKLNTLICSHCPQ